MEEIVVSSLAFTRHLGQVTVTSRSVQSAVRALYPEAVARELVRVGTIHITDYNSEQIREEELKVIRATRRQMKDALSLLDEKARLGAGAPIYLRAVLKKLAEIDAPPTTIVELERQLNAAPAKQPPEALRPVVERNLFAVAMVAASHARCRTVRPADILCAADVLCPRFAITPAAGAEDRLPELQAQARAAGLRLGKGTAARLDSVVTQICAAAAAP